jgi:hypothetical protein
MQGFEHIRDQIQAGMRAHLPDRIQRLGWDAERLAAHQQAGLRRLVGHAMAHSAFHAERLRGFDPDRLTLEDLERLPVMTKSEMMARFDAVVTDPRLTRGLAEQALEATRDEPTPLFDRYFAFARAAVQACAGCSSTTPSPWPSSSAPCCVRSRRASRRWADPRPAASRRRSSRRARPCT